MNGRGHDAFVEPPQSSGMARRALRIGRGREEHGKGLREVSPTGPSHRERRMRAGRDRSRCRSGTTRRRIRSTLGGISTPRAEKPRYGAFTPPTFGKFAWQGPEILMSALNRAACRRRVSLIYYDAGALMVSPPMPVAREFLRHPHAGISSGSGVPARASPPRNRQTPAITGGGGGGGGCRRRSSPGREWPCPPRCPLPRADAGLAEQSHTPPTTPGEAGRIYRKRRVVPAKARFLPSIVPGSNTRKKKSK